MFNVIFGDLFDYVKDRTPLHCIASDHAMGAGIAVPMAEQFNLRKPMNELGKLPWPSCIFVNGVLNMVTKEKSSGKPTYKDFEAALNEVPERCRYYGIKKIVMPKIGCGIDGLDWEKVRAMSEKVLENLDVLVCIPPQISSKQVDALREFEKQVCYAKRMLEDGISSVFLLGHECTDAKRLSLTIERLKRWISCKFESNEDFEKMRTTCKRIEKYKGKR